MSHAPHLVDGRMGQFRYGHVPMRDALVVDGLWCPFKDWAMGEAAEFIADEFEVSRDSMDEFAYGSHQKAIAATDHGKFAAEIVPLTVGGADGQATTVEHDEAPNDLLGCARPPQAGVTPPVSTMPPPRSSSPAANTLRHGASSRWRASWAMRKSPWNLSISSTRRRVIPRLLEKVGWSLTDVDLLELNEAFAAQMLANGYALQDMGWDWTNVNVNSGAIARGYPLGALGARLLTTLLYALRGRDGKRGIASLCLGGGEAVAIAVERKRI